MGVGFFFITLFSLTPLSQAQTQPSEYKLNVPGTSNPAARIITTDDSGKQVYLPTDASKILIQDCSYVDCPPADPREAAKGLVHVKYQFTDSNGNKVMGTTYFERELLKPSKYTAAPKKQNPAPYCVPCNSSLPGEKAKDSSSGILSESEKRQNLACGLKTVDGWYYDPGRLAKFESWARAARTKGEKYCKAEMEKKYVECGANFPMTKDAEFNNASNLNKIGMMVKEAVTQVDDKSNYLDAETVQCLFKREDNDGVPDRLNFSECRPNLNPKNRSSAFGVVMLVKDTTETMYKNNYFTNYCNEFGKYFDKYGECKGPRQVDPNNLTKEARQSLVKRNSDPKRRHKIKITEQTIFAEAKRLAQLKEADEVFAMMADHPQLQVPLGTKHFNELLLNMEDYVSALKKFLDQPNPSADDRKKIALIKTALGDLAAGRKKVLKKRPDGELIDAVHDVIGDYPKSLEQLAEILRTLNDPSEYNMRKAALLAWFDDGGKCGDPVLSCRDCLVRKQGTIDGACGEKVRTCKK